MLQRLTILLFAVTLSSASCGGDKSLTTPTSPGTSTIPGGMQVDPLRDAARAAGKLVGAAVQSGFLADGRYSGVLSRHFNYLTAEYEMKWDPIERTRGENDFKAGDAIVNYPKAFAMRAKGNAPCG